MVMVFVLNTPLTGFSLTEFCEADMSTLFLGSSVLSFVTSGNSRLVVSGNTFLGCVIVSSGPSRVFSSVLSGIVRASVASGSKLLSVVCLFTCTGPCTGSVATGNASVFGVLVCLLALFVSITR